MVVKALILIGGFGTRLRPLTFSKAKPLVEFANKPIVMHQIESLAKAGVKHIILAVSKKTNDMEEAIKRLGETLGIKVTMSVEDTPMGTAGPISLAKDLLDPSDPDPFFMLNADVIANYNFKKLLHFYRIAAKQAHGCEGVIYVTQVDDPSRYGVVDADRETGKVRRFVEKPSTLEYGRDINAGLYILAKSVIDRVPNKPTSIERDTFPAMVADQKLYRLRLDSYWADVGKPGDFLLGQNLYLTAAMDTDEKKQEEEVDLAKGENITSPVLIHPSATVSPDAVLGPNVVIGENCVVKPFARIRDSVIFAGSEIGEGAFVNNSIVGWQTKVGRWCRLTHLCNIGEDVGIAEEVALVGVTVCPHKGVKKSIYEEGTIIL